MKPLDYFYDTPAEGKGHFPQRFAAFFFGLVWVIITPLFRFKFYNADFLKEGRLRAAKKSEQPEQSEQSAQLEQPDQPEQVNQSGFIIAGNHSSYLDPLFVMMALRPRSMRFIGKEEFFKIPGIRRLAAWVGAYPVKRGEADMKAVKRSVTMLKRGELVGIFPEGTRGRGHEANAPREAHEGVALIAQLAKAQVVPVRLWGASEISPPGARRWHFPRITACFGVPLSLADEPYASLDKHQRLTQFTADVMAAVYELENPRDKGKATANKTNTTNDTNDTNDTAGTA
ncbi:MAG: 1-acyl-sn-glycerol-3-phosphate acyltransferase [Coriobacteriia bacterium]|nr:1-acyl-sn-glycerol-3-phosphate acyltransferase [Coriobacteriia bacterium]